MNTRIWKNQFGELRALWKLLLFIGIVGAVANPLVLLLDATNIPVIESSLKNLCVAVAVFCALWAVCRLSSSKFADLGLVWRRTSAGELIKGVVVGSAVMASIVGASWLLGAYHFAYAPQTQFEDCPVGLAIAGQFARYLAGSFFEESVARGFLFWLLLATLRQVELRKRLVLVLLFTSLLFGLLHAGNPSIGAVGLLNLTLAGIFFGLLFVKSGNLAFPIGAHFAWNVTQNNVFGLANSGQKSVASLFVVEHGAGESWLAGGAFGPEGGLVATAILTISIVALGMRTSLVPPVSCPGNSS